MPGTAQPLILPTGKKPKLVSNKSKLFLVCIIILTTYLSGKITILNEIGKHGQTFQELEREISSVASARASQDFSSKGTLENKTDTDKFQIKQIAIGQKASPALDQSASPQRILGEREITDAPAGNIWGIATKIDTHTYTMQVQADSVMANPKEILTALNNYRKQHGSGELVWDDKLADFAKKRAEFFTEKDNLDNHKGFLDYLNNQDGFKKLGFSSIGENSSIGFTLNGVHLIEWVYAGDEEHDGNQLNTEWHYAGIGINGNATDLVFAGHKL